MSHFDLFYTQESYVPSRDFVYCVVNYASEGFIYCTEYFLSSKVYFNGGEAPTRKRTLRASVSQHREVIDTKWNRSAAKEAESRTTENSIQRINHSFGKLAHASLISSFLYFIFFFFFFPSFLTHLADVTNEGKSFPYVFHFFFVRLQENSLTIDLAFLQLDHTLIVLFAR